MCSSMLLVVQSTMVAASIVRGSAPSPTTTSLVLTRSWASAAAGAIRGRSSASDRTADQGDLGIRLSSDAKLGIEGVAQPVAHEVHPEGGEREAGAGKRGQPPGHIEEVAALGQHAAPGRRGR